MTPALQGHLEFFPCFCGCVDVLSDSAPRACKQRSHEGLHEVSSFTGCLGRAGDAAGQSIWKSNYRLPQQRSSGLSPGPSAAADNGERQETLWVPNTFSMVRRKRPTGFVFAFRMSASRPFETFVLERVVPTSTQHRFSLGRTGGRKEQKTSLVFKRDNFPREQPGASWDHRLQAAQHLKLSCFFSFPRCSLMPVSIPPRLFRARGVKPQQHGGELAVSKEGAICLNLAFQCLWH